MIMDSYFSDVSYITSLADGRKVVEFKNPDARGYTKALFDASVSIVNIIDENGLDSYEESKFYEELCTICCRSAIEASVRFFRASTDCEV